jgi:hypothetical protein
MQKQLRQGIEPKHIKLDLNLSVIKPKSLEWLLGAFEELSNNISDKVTAAADKVGYFLAWDRDFQRKAAMQAPRLFDDDSLAPAAAAAEAEAEAEAEQDAQAADYDDELPAVELAARLAAAPRGEVLPEQAIEAEAEEAWVGEDTPEPPLVQAEVMNAAECAMDARMRSGSVSREELVAALHRTTREKAKAVMEEHRVHTVPTQIRNKDSSEEGSDGKDSSSEQESSEAAKDASSSEEDSGTGTDGSTLAGSDREN